MGGEEQHAERVTLACASAVQLKPALHCMPRAYVAAPFGPRTARAAKFFRVIVRQGSFFSHFLRKTVASACTRYARGHFPQNAQGYSFMKAGVRVADNTLTRGLHYMESESEMVLGMVLTLRWNGVDCCLPRIFGC